MISESGHRASFSVFSILAIAFAVLSFVSGGGLGLLFAILAMFTGAVGFVLAILPGTRGGVASFLAVLGGLFGVIVAIVKLISRP